MFFLLFSSTHLSFSFAFFVHGESSVCASVDVRQHPPVRKLSRCHLQLAQTSSTGLQVILAPFGLAGTLTGQSYNKSPEATARLLEDWAHFYPLDNNRNVANGDGGVVEVIVGGIKMRYPACYVLVTDMDEEAATVTTVPATTPTTTANTNNSNSNKNGSSKLFFNKQTNSSVFIKCFFNSTISEKFSLLIITNFLSRTQLHR